MFPIHIVSIIQFEVANKTNKNSSIIPICPNWKGKLIHPWWMNVGLFIRVGFWLSLIFPIRWFFIYFSSSSLQIQCFNELTDQSISLLPIDWPLCISFLIDHVVRWSRFSWFILFKLNEFIFESQNVLAFSTFVILYFHIFKMKDFFSFDFVLWGKICFTRLFYKNKKRGSSFRSIMSNQF